MSDKKLVIAGIELDFDFEESVTHGGDTEWAQKWSCRKCGWVAYCPMDASGNDVAGPYIEVVFHNDRCDPHPTVQDLVNRLYEDMRGHYRLHGEELVK